MRRLIVKPDTKEKLAALKAFLKALKIPFEEAKSPYAAEFVAKITRGEKDISTGKTKRISLDEIWKSCNYLDCL